MKQLLAWVTLMGVMVQAGAQGFILNQGQSANFSFTSLDYLSGNTNMFSVARSGLGFIAPGLSAGQSIQIEFYPDSSFQGAAFFTQSITVPNSGIFYGSVGFETSSTAWDDLDGGVRVTMLNGAAGLEGVFFDVNRPGERYFRLQPVPEPGVWAIGALGGVLLCFFGRAAGGT